MSLRINNTPTWRKLKARMEQDRADLVEALIICSEEKKADILRGKIMQLDDILENYSSKDEVELDEFDT